jgi:hypothetical protein
MMMRTKISGPQTTPDADFTMVEISKSGQKTRISFFESQCSVPVRREEKLNSDGSINESKEMAANHIVITMLDPRWGGPDAFCKMIEQKLSSKGINVSLTIEAPVDNGCLSYLKFSAAPELFPEILSEVCQSGECAAPHYYSEFITPYALTKYTDCDDDLSLSPHS